MKIGEIVSIIMVLISGIFSHGGGMSAANLSSYISSSLNASINASISGSEIRISASGMPSDLIPELMRASEMAYEKTHASHITATGYAEMPEGLEPCIRLSVVDGDFSHASIEDIRSPEFRAKGELILYDFMPKFVKLSGSSVIADVEYAGRLDELKENVANAAFNIFEDIPSAQQITFNFEGAGNSSITRQDIFGVGSRPSNGCAESKEEAYQQFVRAYNKVVDAQQKEDMDAAKAAYDEYLKARACYENFTK